MREIKFRAWDKHNKKWITEPVGFTMSVVDGKFHIFGFDDAFADMYQIRVELQQSTGLKDKNGVEIYEGDIVDWPLDHGSIAVIEYRGSMFGGVWKPEDFWTPLDVFQNIEVIGNISENPELLK